MIGKNTLEGFEKAFYDQCIFQERVEGEWPSDSPKRFQYHMNSMTEELGEVLKSDKRWKTHRNKTFDPDEKMKEIADMFITAINITMWSGFSYDDLMQGIEGKIKENNNRLEREI